MNRRLPIAILAALCVASCSADITELAEPAGVQFVYSPATGQVPLPNDILFLGSLDATLNFPPASVPAQQPLFDALNSLDGWSTSAPGSFAFASEVDPATVAMGTSVRLFEVTLGSSPTTGLTLGQPVLSVVSELVPGTDYVVAASPSDPTNATYAVVPTQPFVAKKSYMLVVTNGVTDLGGVPVRPSDTYIVASSDVINHPLQPNHPLAGLQVLINAMENVASTDAGVVPLIPRAEIVVTLTFTTQSLFEGLSAVQAVAAGGEQLVLNAICAGSPSPAHLACSAAPANTVPSSAPGGFVGPTDALLPGATGHADVYTASLTLPYYLTAAANMNGGPQDTAPLTERWTSRFSFLEGTGVFDPMETDNNVTQYNPLPLQTGAEIVPMLISLPNGASGQVEPVTGWPVAIFQHGITSNRSTMIALADSLADAGFACVAIDLPLHGIVDPANPLHVGTQDGALRERTFGLDLVTQDGAGNVTATVPDGTPDSSGAHFINLTSLQTQRDNLRQSVADLFAVVKMITDNSDVDGSVVIVGPDFDPAQIHFVGMSLGAIVGTTFVAVDAASAAPAIKSATLNVPGGGIPRLLEASPTFGPTLIAGLAAAGVIQGTPDFDTFMVVAQTTIDSGDPINFAPSLAGGALPIILHEVVGGGPGGGLTDQVIPNSVPGAPLSGTDPLRAQLGLALVTAVGATPSSAAAVRFSEGSHSSLLNPGLPDPEDFATFVEMQTQVSLWLASIATAPTVTITDGTVIAP